MEDFSVCPACSLTDMGAELKKPKVSLQSKDHARLCSPRKEGNWEGRRGEGEGRGGGERGRGEGGEREGEGEGNGGRRERARERV